MTNTLPQNIQDLLDPTMRSSLTASVKSGTKTYILVTQTDDESGGEILIEQLEGGISKIISSDSSLYPFDLPNIPKDVATKLNDSIDPDNSLFTDHADILLGVISPTTNEELNRRVLRKAKECDNTLKSGDVPGTDHGNLACAWAVNEVVKRTLGRPIGGKLSTAKLYEVLKEEHTLVSGSNIKAGNIIISPTAEGVTGHVGIVGDIVNPISDTIIYSNSSTRKVFYHNYKFSSWKKRYNDDKGLKMLVYALEKDRFQEGA